MTSGLPSASVVVAVRNAEGFVGDCIRSLLALDYPRDRLEIVAVDNDSTDGTARVLFGFGDEISVVHAARRGPAAARNAGIRTSSGDVVAIVDADSTVDRMWLAALVPPFGDPAVGIAGGAIVAPPGAGRVERFGELVHDAYSAVHVWRPPYVATGNWASPRAVLDEVGLFDERLKRCSDVDFSWRAVEAGYRLEYCASAIVYHRNERTLVGLFREGCTHGFHAVALRQRYARLIAEQRSTGGRRPEPAGAPARAFRSGKRVGNAVGRLWQAAR